jgi:hypothetical protein
MFNFEKNWGCGTPEFINNTDIYSSYYYRNQHQFSLPQTLYQKLTIDFHELVTNNPLKANLFWIPVNFQCIDKSLLSISNTSMFLKNNGADHVVVMSRGLADQYRFDIKNILNEHVGKNFLWISFGIFGWSMPFTKRFQYPAKNVLAAPRASSVYNLTQFIPRTERPYFTSFIGNIKYPSWRKNISQQCLAEEQKCFHGEKTRKGATKANYASTYTKSIFVFTPGGDDADRKGLWDVLASGAIPIIFEEITIDARYPNLFPNPRKFSIFMNTTHNMIFQLEQISNETIDAMLQTIWKMRFKFQYIIGVKNDAFLDIIKSLENYVKNNYTLPLHPWKNESKVKCVQFPEISNPNRNLNEPSEKCRFQ